MFELTREVGKSQLATRLWAGDISHIDGELADVVVRHHPVVEVVAR